MPCPTQRLASACHLGRHALPNFARSVEWNRIFLLGSMDQIAKYLVHRLTLGPAPRPEPKMLLPRQFRVQLILTVALTQLPTVALLRPFGDPCRWPLVVVLV